MAKWGGQIAVNGKVKPLEGIAKQGGQGGGAPLLGGLDPLLGSIT